MILAASEDISKRQAITIEQLAYVRPAQPREQVFGYANRDIRRGEKVTFSVGQNTLDIVVWQDAGYDGTKGDTPK